MRRADGCSRNLFRPACELRSQLRRPIVKGSPPWMAQPQSCGTFGRWGGLPGRSSVSRAHQKVSCAFFGSIFLGRGGRSTVERSGAIPLVSCAGALLSICLHSSEAFLTPILFLSWSHGCRSGGKRPQHPELKGPRRRVWVAVQCDWGGSASFCAPLLLYDSPTQPPCPLFRANLPSLL